jgi:hypothetical protein
VHHVCNPRLSVAHVRIPRLTDELRGGAEAPDDRRGRRITVGACSDVTEYQGPRERLLETDSPVLSRRIIQRDVQKCRWSTTVPFPVRIGQFPQAFVFRVSVQGFPATPGDLNQGVSHQGPDAPRDLNSDYSARRFLAAPDKGAFARAQRVMPSCRHLTVSLSGRAAAKKAHYACGIQMARTARALSSHGRSKRWLDAFGTVRTQKYQVQ